MRIDAPIIKEEKEQKPWYSTGLRFSCTQCGQCCTGSPGRVWVTNDEIKALATFLNLEINVFSKRYLRFVDGRFSLIEIQTSHNTYDCVFLKNRKCLVYPVRPNQCKTFPWWPQNLVSEESWQEAAKKCEGINDSAPCVPFDEIKKQLLSLIS